MKAPRTAEKYKLNGKKSSGRAPNGSFPMAGLIDEPVRSGIPQELTTLEEGTRKQEKKKRRAQKKVGENGNGSAKAPSGPFPMIELIDEQVRTSIPKELVAKVKQAKKKKYIISSNYPYPKE